MSDKLTDADLKLPTHQINELDKKSGDFESRLRALEKYQNEQIGFFAANKLWITLGVTFIISTVVNVLIKVYIQ